MRDYPWGELFGRLGVAAVGVLILCAAAYVATVGTGSPMDPAAALLFGLIGLSTLAQAVAA